MGSSGLLSSLSLEDLAIIDRLQLSFGPGLNVLTGETGAGKSILVQGLSLLLGGRGSADWVRSGAEEAAVEGLFELSPKAVEQFAARGIEVVGRELVVRRTIHRSGKSRVFLNGQLATVGLLQELMRGTIDISGQHEHISLFQEDHHLDILDAYSGATELAEQLAGVYAEKLRVDELLDSARRAAEDRARREDYLRFQLEELTELSPQAGELDALERERLVLRHASRLKEVAQDSEAVLYSGEDAVVDRMSRIERELAQAALLDARFEPIAQRIQATLSEVEDLSRDLVRHAGSIEADPERLEQVESRLESLKRLTKKHGGSLERAIEAQDALREELDRLVESEARCAEHEAQSAALLAECQTIATRLSRARQAGAQKIAKALEQELGSLSLSGARFEVRLTELASLGPRGLERAAFLFAPNAGEPARALAKTASGGELSRVLLALKVILADCDGVSTYVFDEVDAGIGGTVASVLGKKLEDVARSRQVLCITHLPQVAAHADRHFLVRKEAKGGRTMTRVGALDPEASAHELARMLAGAEVTARSLELAVELRARAKARRTPEGTGNGRGRRRRAA